jgi:extracellular elastinolytic metalloproteinase
VSGRSPRTRRGALTIFVAAGLSLGGIPQGVAAPSHKNFATQPLLSGPSQRERAGFVDTRIGSPKAQLSHARQAVMERQPGFSRLASSLGVQGIADIDPATGTPRNLGKTNGFLTKRSPAGARSIAMGFVRSHVAALGLTSSDLATFQFRRDYVDIAGIHHLSWTQSALGVTLFGNGLKANVTEDGRLISIQGSPVSGLARMAANASTATALSASEARAAAAADVGGAPAAVDRTTLAKSGAVTWANNDYAVPVWFNAGGQLRRAWSTYVQAGNSLDYQHVIDAETGEVLYRADTVDWDKGDARVFENYPGAAVDGTQHVVNLIDLGMLPKSARYLSGPHVVAWSDVNDDDLASKSERVVVPGTGGGPAQYRLRPFGTNASALCSPSFRCTWNPNTANSWQRNRNADVTQGFYLDNKMHNWLQRKPIGFTPQAGNFSGDDPVLLNALDGADTDNGLPDAAHIDNANMNTPPDGIPPTMQMYLFHAPGATDTDDPFLPASSSFDPSVILHEYTHGLSNRLVLDAAGNGALNTTQAGSMGEGWSDWYASDYLVTKGLERDTDKPGQILMGRYVGAGAGIRTMPMDCPVDTDSPRCTDLHGAAGGYTYGDFSNVVGFAEVHASGEIWAQTLWDLRDAVGHSVAVSVVTRAMELSPPEPSFLDMRNAILQADLAVYGGDHRRLIWQVFAKRGMGYFAGALDSGDTAPVEDFSMPPPPQTPRGTVRGQVTDGITHDALGGVVVAISGHNSGFVGDYADVTDASGRYTIPNVLSGTYPELVAYVPGYEVQAVEVTVDQNGASADFDPRRDWAASSQGGEVVEFDGGDFTDFGCGPNELIDLNQGTGWGSTAGNDAGDPTNVFVPKSIVVKLPSTVDVNAFAVNPSNTCGDDPTAATADYRIETSPDNVDWTVVQEGTFDETDLQRNEIPLDTPSEGVQYVRFTILSNLTPNFATACPNAPLAGCSFADVTELEVFGPVSAG